MMDLYEAIGVPFGSSDDAIKLAIARTRASNQWRANRVEAILMLPQRRRAYDRLWMSLTRIGKVRALAELNHAPFGARAEYAEFRFKAPRKNEAEPSNSYVGKQSTLRLRDALIILGSAIAFAGFWYVSKNDKSPAASAPLQQFESKGDAVSSSTVAMAPMVVTADLPPAVELKPHPLPETGDGETLVKAGKDNWIQIRTSGEHHTLVKVERPNGQLVAKRFIRAADKLRIYLPLGTYVLKTSTGRQWYGEKERFGPDASFSKPDDIFPLNKPGEYWEVELILQRGGNMSQSAISEEEFGAD